MNDRTSQDWIDKAERVSEWLETATPQQIEDLAVKMAEAKLGSAQNSDHIGR